MMHQRLCDGGQAHRMIEERHDPWDRARKYHEYERAAKALKANMPTECRTCDRAKLDVQQHYRVATDDTIHVTSASCARKVCDHDLKQVGLHLETPMTWEREYANVFSTPKSDEYMRKVLNAAERYQDQAATKYRIEPDSQTFAPVPVVSRDTPQTADADAW